MMRPGLYYFAHPYTVKDEDGHYVYEAEEANFNLANIRAGKLIEAGYLIYSPISHTHPIHATMPQFLARHEHQRWYEIDAEFIANANWRGIILAPLWETSTGCRGEKAIFEEHGKEILFYCDLVRDGF